MNNIDDTNKESKESSTSTVELLASLFQESKESKIKRVKEKARPRSAIRKNHVDVRVMNDLQQRTPTNRRVRRMKASASEMEARSTKKKAGTPKPAVPGTINKRSPGIKAPVQEKGRKMVTKGRSVQAVPKHGDKRTIESSVPIRKRPAISEACVLHQEANRHPQRRSMFGSTTLGIGLLFAMGVLLTLLGTRLVPFDFLDSDQGIALAKNEMVENFAPKKPDVAIPTVPAGSGESAKQEKETETPEPPIKPEKGTVGGATLEKPGNPVSGTPQKTMVTAKQEVPSVNPEPSRSTHSNQVTRTKTAQRDASKSYPYSVYFGSYKHIDRAREAVSSLGKKGLSPYWVRVDLGDKGVWYRVLAGYFQTKDEVKAFIEKHQITEGRSRYVLYANLIGGFSSNEELKEKKHSLVGLGYCPYVVDGDDGESLLFTGAFYYRADAEKEHIELASKGIQSQLVKR